MSSADSQIIAYVKGVVADACDIDKGVLDDSHLLQHHKHIRWFLWYSIRYLTHETYHHIAVKTKTSDGKCVTKDTVGKGVLNMMRMTEQDFMWMKRWRKVKPLLDEVKNMETSNMKGRRKITVIVPFDVEVEIKKQ